MRRVLREWATAVFRPVSINLLSAFFLFAFAVAFRADILGLFGLDRVEGYPIVCAAELYRPPGGEDEVWLDFFLVNSSGDRFDEHIDLIDELKEKNSNPDLDLSPDIHFTVNDALAQGFRKTVKMDQAAASFNRGKGEVTASLTDDRKTVIIRLDEIGPYNVLKTTVAIEGYDPNIGEERGFVPFIPIQNRENVFERCYTVD